MSASGQSPSYLPACSGNGSEVPAVVKGVVAGACGVYLTTHSVVIVLVTVLAITLITTAEVAVRRSQRLSFPSGNGNLATAPHGGTCCRTYQEIPHVEKHTRCRGDGEISRWGYLRGAWDRTDEQ